MQDNRNTAIDLLKCLAMILITNSHFGLLYGRFDYLATGGTIGDALFFFCSGFALFLKPMDGLKGFADWYKRRINRIYPPVIAAALVGTLFFARHYGLLDIVLARDYWFVGCIMLYYVAIYFIGSYLRKAVPYIGLAVLVGAAVWFLLIDYAGFQLFGGHYIRWLVFFAIMLAGSWLGMHAGKLRCRPVLDAVLAVVSVALFYAILLVSARYGALARVQYLSVVTLLAAVYYIYKVCASPLAVRLFGGKGWNRVIRAFGGLCLEVYLVQYFLITDRLNNLFPLNVVIVALGVLLLAYLTRCLARFLSQTFYREPYNWKEIIRLY